MVDLNQPFNRETLSNWCDQYRAELEKIAAARAAQLEELLIALNHDAAIDWLKQWQDDDAQPDSVAYQYQKSVQLLRKTTVPSHVSTQRLV